MTPDPTRSLEVYADADFCGLFNQSTALYDPVTAKSRTGYLVLYMGCPIIWASKLQTETALSTSSHPDHGIVERNKIVWHRYRSYRDQDPLQALL